MPVGNERTQSNEAEQPPLHAIPLDAPLQKPTATLARSDDNGTNLLSIMGEGIKKNAVAPAINSFAIEPINTGVNVVNGVLEGGTWLVNQLGADVKAPQLGKISEMETGKPAEGSTASYSQQIFGTAGSFLVYAVTSKMAGKAMRTGAELLPLESEIKSLRKASQAVRTFAQDTRVATVLGATTYAGLKDVKEGESHFSNAASTFIGFTAFEAGNSKFVNNRANKLTQIGQRFTVGYAGGVAQTNVASLIQQHQFAGRDADMASGLSGGALNALMPAGHKTVDALARKAKVFPYASEAATKLHTDAIQALPAGAKPEPGTWADPNAIKAVKKAAIVDLHTRVDLKADGPTRVDHTQNVIPFKAGDSPLKMIQELAHRQVFKDPKYEAQFKSHAAEIHSTDPADPRNQTARDRYVETRIDQEVAAREKQNIAAAEIKATERACVDRSTIRDKEGYGARFQAEADNFIKTGGKTRPVEDYAGVGGGHDGHAAGHPIQEVSNAHATGDHTVGNHDAGPGGGNGRRTGADGRDPATVTTAERAALERNADLRDWPAVFDPACDQGVGFEPPSNRYPQGRELYWYKYNNYARVNGHDNVVFAAHYDLDVNDVMLVKRNPANYEFSVVRTNNSEVPEFHSDGNGGVFQTKSVEKFFHLDANDTPVDRLFDSPKLTPRAIKYEVVVGNETIPSNCTYTVFDHAQTYEIQGATVKMDGKDVRLPGEKIYPKSYIEYHDGSGRIDWHQDWPYENVVTEYREPQKDDGFSYRVSVPQSMPGSMRYFRLTEDGHPNGITDRFAAEHPLKMDFGEAVQVDRVGDKDVYTMKDGSATLIMHYDTHMVMGRFENGGLVGKPERIEGYSERYATPWRTVFGEANEVHIMPNEARYELVNGGEVTHLKKPGEVEGFKNVDWIYSDPSGDRVIQLRDGAQTRIKLPSGGAYTGVLGLPLARGVQVIPGQGGFRRYYFNDGQVVDVLPDRPGVGIYQEKPGVYSEIGGYRDEHGTLRTQKLTWTFDGKNRPVTRVEMDGVVVHKATLSEEACRDLEGQPKPVKTDVYKNGLMTKWGLALERKIYPSGHSLLTLAHGDDATHTISLDLHGNQISRDGRGKQILIPEPADFPRFTDVNRPRYTVSFRDVPESQNPAHANGPEVREGGFVDDAAPEPPPHDPDIDLYDRGYR